MCKMVRLTDDELLALGKAGRAMLEAGFNEGEVFQSYLSAIAKQTRVYARFDLFITGLCSHHFPPEGGGFGEGRAATS